MEMNTELLYAFDEKFQETVLQLGGAWIRLKSVFIWLLAALSVVQAGIMLIQYGLHGKAETPPIALLLKVVFWWIAVFSFPQIMLTVKWTAIRLGAMGASSPILAEPSAILRAGWKSASTVLTAVMNVADGLDDASRDMFGKVNDLGALARLLFFNMPKLSIGLIIWVVVMACYIIIMLQVFLGYAEFAILAGSGVILLPFGICQYTTFMPEKLAGAIAGHAVKLLILQFIIGTGMNVFGDNIVEPGTSAADIAYIQLVAIAVNALIYAALVVKLPSLAVGILAGHPRLTNRLPVSIPVSYRPYREKE